MFICLLTKKTKNRVMLYISLNYLTLRELYERKAIPRNTYCYKIKNSNRISVKKTTYPNQEPAKYVYTGEIITAPCGKCKTCMAL